MALIDTKRLEQLFLGDVPFPSRRSFLSTLVKIVRRTLSRALLACRGALLLEGHAEPVVTLPQLGTDLQSLLKCAHSPREVAALTQRLAELILNAGIGRFAFGDASQMHERALGVAFFPQRDAQVHMRRQVVGLECQGLLKGIDGLTEFATLGKGGCQVRVSPGILRVERDRLPKLRNGS